MAEEKCPHCGRSFSLKGPLSNAIQQRIIHHAEDILTEIQNGKPPVGGIYRETARRAGVSVGTAYKYGMIIIDKKIKLVEL